MLAAECLALQVDLTASEICSKCDCSRSGGSDHDLGHLSPLKEHGDHEHSNLCIRCCRKGDTSSHGDGPHGHDDGK
ncbi:unnamed protein product [Caenorhabditis nigoni]